MKNIYLILIMMMSTQAFSAELYDVTLTWDRPTERIDGEQVNIDAVVKYKLCLMIESLESCDRVEVVDTTTFVFKNVVPRDATNVYFKMKAITEKIVESDWSNVVSKRVNPLKAPLLRGE